MTEEIKVFEEEMEQAADVSEENKDALKGAIEERFKQLQTQSMLLGAQTMAQVIIDKITVWERQPGKRTLNDHRRLIKDVKSFCETGVSRKVNHDGTTSSIEDDSVKLTEEVNE
jgi:hypothetical protein